jgi:alkanesulfonate monooxygenase SsuD/methylene tetrahydromethanopterin reductase-like flavin-dependent oxidoreductase (luciferase family)
VGGDSPTALARVARRADGSIVSRLRPDQVAERRERLAGLAAPYGRADVHFHLVALRWLAIDADDAVARARAEATLGQMQRGGRPISGDVRYVGGPGRLQELLAADRSAGIDEVILQVVAGSESEVLDGLARFRDDVVAPLAAGSSV